MSIEGRTQKAGKNFVMGIMNKVIVLLLTFISRRLFIQYIGVQFLGINGLFSNVLTLLSMADLGFGVAMSYSLYEPLATNDEKKIAALINFYKKVYNTIAAAVAVIGICITPFLKYLINTDREIEYIHIYYLVFLANTVISYLFVYKSTVISADQKSYIINRYSIILSVAKIILQMIVIVFLKNYFTYILMEVLYTLCNNLLISHKADKMYPYIKQKVVLEKGQRRHIISNMKSVFLYKVSGVLLNGIDNIVMSVMVGTVFVGYYSNYQTIIINVTAFVGIAFNSITASVGNVVVTENEDSRYRLFKTMQMISFWLGGIITVSIGVLIQDFITIWLGKEFLLDSLSIVAITLNLYFSTTLYPVWTYREATGLYQKTKYVMLIAAGINLVLSIVMAKYLGVSGVIFATVLSKFLTYFWYEPKLLYEMYFRQKVFKYYLDYFIELFMVVGMIALLTYIFQFIVISNIIISFVTKAIISVLIINLILFIRYFKTEEFAFLMEKIKRMMRRRSS